MKSGAFAIILFSFMMNDSLANTMVKQSAKDADILELSQQLLLQAKSHEPTASLVEKVKNISEKQLKAQLINDDYKKAFWINIYNAYTQVILSKNPEKYKNKGSFFSDKIISIAGRQLSLDEVEHGILRRSKIKWSLGHLNKWFPSAFEKEQRVDTLDYRIHFSLNCGAKSCPPIAFYKPEHLDRQLDIATKAYLSAEAEYSAVENTIALPAIMGWFRADFGGKDNMLHLLHALQIVPAAGRPAIKFKDYNWSLFLENYKSE